jgi:hypothetical protein
MPGYVFMHADVTDPDGYQACGRSHVSGAHVRGTAARRARVASRQVAGQHGTRTPG